MGYIYRITNKLNGKKYIGKTEYTNPFKRYNQHLKERTKDRCKGRAIYKALNKYGPENFQFDIVEEVPNELLNEKEKYYIELFDTYKSGYNETIGGDGTSYILLEKDEIISRYLSGQTINEISKEMKHDHSSIAKILKQNNIDIYYTPKNKLPVAQINPLTSEIIKIFPSAFEAEKEVNTGKHINEACKGTRVTAGGYKWAYYNGEMSESG